MGSKYKPLSSDERNMLQQWLNEGRTVRGMSGESWSLAVP